MCITTDLHCLSKRVQGCSCLNMRNRTKTEAKSNENLNMVTSTSVLCRFLLSAKVRHYLHRVFSVFFIITSRRKEGKSFELPAGFMASVFATAHSGRRVGRTSSQVWPTHNAWVRFTVALSIQLTVHFRMGSKRRINCLRHKLRRRLDEFSFLERFWRLMKSYVPGIYVYVCDVPRCNLLNVWITLNARWRNLTKQMTDLIVYK
jgi:hypothetical protein